MSSTEAFILGLLLGFVAAFSLCAYVVMEAIWGK